MIERIFGSPASGVAFSLRVPTDWIDAPIEFTTNDFSDPTALVPLAVLHDPRNAITLTIDARPTDESRSLKGWAYAIQEAHRLSVYSLDEQDIGEANGVAGTATDAMSPDSGTVRFAFLEINEHLVRLSMTASHSMGFALLAKWDAVIGSFALLDEEGVPMRKPEPYPNWWAQAKEFERNNQLEEAETLIKNAVPHLGYASQLARLYADRMIRLKEEGDRTGAAEAHEKAVRWIRDYASFATSGGEGAALSLERDEFIAELGPVP